MEHSTTQTPQLQAIFSKRALAASIGVPYRLLDKRAFTNHQHLLYSLQEHPKRDGTFREIWAPAWPLRNIQRKIAELLSEMYYPSSRATGYISGRDTKYNASFHLGKRLLLNLDLEDFFPSINFGRIRGRLMAKPYGLNSEVATTIARLCTLDGQLPIGAPSSPVISNMIASHLDGILTRIAREHGCFYSRYADDITLSTNRRSFPTTLVVRHDPSGRALAGKTIVEGVNEAGFTINAKKTRVLDRSSRQEITGIVINEFPNVRRSLMREVRGALNAWEKHGREAAKRVFDQKFNFRGALTLEAHLRGRIAHIAYVRGTDDLTVWKLVDRFNKLDGRENSSIAYDQPRNERERLISAVCRIESGDDDAMEFKQGSGIKLPNGNILTNFHNVEIADRIAPQIDVFLSDTTQFSIDARVIRYDPAKDVAILEPTDREWKAAIAAAATELSFSECEISQQIKLGGFPSYLIGDSCQIANGEVRAFSKIENIRYFRVSVPIVKGNSGGPVFNIKGQVIGIASRGVDTHEVSNVAFNGCLELFRIEKFIRE